MATFRFHPGLLLRTPALSYTSYHPESLPTLLLNPYFRAALRLASPALYQVVEGSNFTYEALAPKVKASLQKYLNRMCFRPTPFGLFSGFALCSWGTPEPLILQQEKSRAHLSLTFSCSKRLAAELLANELAPAQRFRPNPSLYKVPGGYRYIRFQEDATGSKREFSIDNLQGGRILERLLRVCSDGYTCQQLIGEVVKLADVEEAEAALYVEQLQSEQVLVPLSGMRVTGADSLSGLLEESKAQSIASPRVEQIGCLLSGLKKAGQVTQVSESALFEELPQEALADLAISPENDLQATLENTVQGTLETAYQAKLAEALDCLQRLVPAPEPTGLRAFANAFSKKFDQRAVPLLTALDPELGVGYEDLAVRHQAPRLLESIKLEEPPTTTQSLNWTPAHRLLLEKWQSAGAFPNELILSGDDLEQLPAAEEALLPPSFSVVFRPMGEEVYLEQAGGISATTLLGRFTPLHDGVRSMARDIAAAEEKYNPGVIFAEIGYYNNAHTANIDRREAVRSYEIPVLVPSAHPVEKQVQLSELWVMVEAGRIVLWSERLRKEVVPRLGSAYNYFRDDLAVFRFLCDLQYQGLRSNFTLELSHFFPGLTYYPRVRYKQSILHLACWHLQEKQLAAIFEKGEGSSLLRLKQLAESMHWPRHVALTQNDQQLVFDLEREANLCLLLESIKGKTSVQVREFPFTAAENQLVTDAVGQPYVHQFITAVYQERTVYQAQPLPILSASKRKSQKRTFAPGEEWLYFKIYCHPSRANQLLAHTLLPLCHKLQQAGAVTQWYFVRYRDPDYHLRLRLKVLSGAGQVMEQVSRKLSGSLRQGLLQDVQLAVYEQELERYGPELIETAEQVFWANSRWVGEYLRQVPFGEEEYAFYHMAFLGLEEVLEAFGFSAGEKETLLEQLYHTFYQEFGATKALRLSLAATYRELSQVPGILSDDGIKYSPPLKKQRKAHREALQMMAKLAEKLPFQRRQQLASDLMHMHLNRLLSDRSRQQELVIYFCYWKYCRSARARSTA
ncbi:lantibiotic dehydratase [Pontibacter chinhatensis]|uniref:Thiopeptide-type bacteriocin biosynthesis domain-containing protein n=1 Tax=Pontibacter chinhatensis TaxID=1436961 RepID=A0A1I2N8V9_9BACT|nr:lantibiotic dehydratase [Pontibacter chinhatensis]SFF99309.1 thiopeptide-type bacteriocin biosynthesis domain-containing protein [Pontibacter chinhatensis]